MNHKMVLSYDYSSQNRWQWRTNVPSRAISMTMALRQCNTERIAQCSMTRASPEATGRRHQATTHSVSRQGDNQHNDNGTCTHFAGRFDGHRDAVVLYRTHRPMEEVRGFHKSH